MIYFNQLFGDSICFIVKNDEIRYNISNGIKTLVNICKINTTGQAGDTAKKFG